MVKQFDELMLLLNDFDAKFSVLGSGADKHLIIYNVVPVKVLPVLRFLVENHLKCSICQGIDGITVYNKVLVGG